MVAPHLISSCECRLCLLWHSMEYAGSALFGSERVNSQIVSELLIEFPPLPPREAICCASWQSVLAAQYSTSCVGQRVCTWTWEALPVKVGPLKHSPCSWAVFSTVSISRDSSPDGGWQSTYNHTIKCHIVVAWVDSWASVAAVILQIMLLDLKAVTLLRWTPHLSGLDDYGWTPSENNLLRGQIHVTDQAVSIEELKVKGLQYYRTEFSSQNELNRSKRVTHRLSVSRVTSTSWRFARRYASTCFWLGKLIRTRCPVLNIVCGPESVYLNVRGAASESGSP
jgi:hypothetical protein